MTPTSGLSRCRLTPQLRSFLFFAAASWLAAGCAGLNTAPVRPGESPELTIPNTGVDKVIELLNREMLAREYYIRSLSSNQVVYGMQTNSFAFKLLYSREQYVQAELRVTYDFKYLEATRGVFVKGTSEIVINPGSLMEDHADQNNWEMVQVMTKVLNSVRAKLAAVPAQPAP